MVEPGRIIGLFLHSWDQINTFDALVKGFTDYFYDEEAEEEYGEITLSDEFKQFLQTLIDLKHLGEHFLDSSDQNFLMRGDQVVMIDPLVNHSDLDINLEIYRFAEDNAHDKNITGKTTARTNRS